MAGEGGSSDVAVEAAGLRQSPAEPRKKETTNKKEEKEVRKPGGQVDRDETRVVLTAHGDAQGRAAAMERSAEEDYKEKLLWNVKREVGDALARSCRFTLFNGCFLFLITWKHTRGCFVTGAVAPTLGVSDGCHVQVYQMMLN